MYFGYFMLLRFLPVVFHLQGVVCFYLLQRRLPRDTSQEKASAAKSPAQERIPFHSLQVSQSKMQYYTCYSEVSRFREGILLRSATWETEGMLLKAGIIQQYKTKFKKQDIYSEGWEGAISMSGFPPIFCDVSAVSCKLYLANCILVRGLSSLAKSCICHSCMPSSWWLIKR